MRSGRCYEHRTSELPTNASGSSSWPTANAMGGTGYMSGANRDTWRPTLAGAAQGLRPVLHKGRPQWPTPNVPDGGRSMPEQDVVARGMTPRGKRQVDLASAARVWPTPVAEDTHRSPQAHLEMRAEMEGGPRSTVTSLAVAANLWPTVTAGDGKSAGVVNNWTPESGRHSGTTLTDAARLWPTASARDSKGRDQPWRTGGQGLPETAIATLPAPTTGRPGQTNRPVLNPRFVEAMMGLPTGWALPMPLSTINLGSSATASSPPRPPRPFGSSSTALSLLDNTLWPTPQAHDAIPGNAARVGRYGTLHGGRDLNDWAAKWVSDEEGDA